MYHYHSVLIHSQKFSFTLVSMNDDWKSNRLILSQLNRGGDDVTENLYDSARIVVHESVICVRGNAACVILPENIDILPHITFSVCSLRNGTKSLITVPSLSFKDFIMRLLSSIITSTNCCNILKWNVGVSILRRVCHLLPERKNQNHVQKSPEPFFYLSFEVRFYIVLSIISIWL